MLGRPVALGRSGSARTVRYRGPADGIHPVALPPELKSLLVLVMEVVSVETR
jgi:hypothetical protein